MFSLITAISSRFSSINQYKKAIKLLQQPNTQTEAIQMLHQCQVNGISEANESLGVIYLRGIGVTPDIEKAIHFFQNVQDISGSAAFHLASIFKQHKNDTETAFKYLEKSSLLGNNQATTTLALWQAQGIGCTPNLEKALPQLEKDAITNQDSATVLGSLYFQGKAVPKDLYRSAHFYQVALELCEKRFPKSNFQCHHQNFDLACVLYELEQYSLANEHFKISSTSIPQAFLRLAFLHLEEKLPDSNIDQGVSYLQKASDSGIKEAQFQLGLLLYNGYTSTSGKNKKSISVGYGLITKAANQGLELAKEWIKKSERKEIDRTQSINPSHLISQNDIKDLQPK